MTQIVALCWCSTGAKGEWGAVRAGMVVEAVLCWGLGMMQTAALCWWSTGAKGDRGAVHQGMVMQSIFTSALGQPKAAVCAVCQL